MLKFFQFQNMIKKDEKAVAQKLVRYLQQFKDLLNESGKCFPENLKNASKSVNEIKKCFNKSAGTVHRTLSPDEKRNLENELRENSEHLNMKIEKFSASILKNISEFIDVNLDPKKFNQSLINQGNEKLRKLEFNNLIDSNRILNMKKNFKKESQDISKNLAELIDKIEKELQNFEKVEWTLDSFQKHLDWIKKDSVKSRSKLDWYVNPKLKKIELEKLHKASQQNATFNHTIAMQLLDVLEYEKSLEEVGRGELYSTLNEIQNSLKEVDAVFAKKFGEGLDTLNKSFPMMLRRFFNDFQNKAPEKLTDFLGRFNEGLGKYIVVTKNLTNVEPKIINVTDEFVKKLDDLLGKRRKIAQKLNMANPVG